MKSQEALAKASVGTTQATFGAVLRAVADAAESVTLRAPMAPVLFASVSMFWLTVPGFASGANLANMALLFAPLLIAAIGITFVLLIGGIDLSIGSTLSLASVIGAIAMRETGSLWIGATAGMATGLAIGSINGCAIAVFRLPAFVHTFGMLLTIRAAALLVTGGHSIGRLPFSVMTFGRGALFGIPHLLWVAILVLVISNGLLTRTRLGREMYLVGTNRRAGIFNGLRVRFVEFTAYLLCGGFAGLAGVCVVMRLGAGGPVIGDNILLIAIAAAVLGGTSILGGEGGVFRTLSGTGVIVLLDKGLNLLGLSFYDQAVVIGAVIVLGSSFSVLLQRRLSPSRARTT